MLIYLLTVAVQAYGGTKDLASQLDIFAPLGRSVLDKLLIIAVLGRAARRVRDHRRHPRRRPAQGRARRLAPHKLLQLSDRPVLVVPQPGDA